VGEPRTIAPNAPLECLHAGRHLRLVQRGGWEWVERIRGSGVVAIVALTPKAKLILVEQFRAPVGCRVIELPAGISGDIQGQESEGLIVAAKRELLEETGYVAKRWQELTAGPSSAGLTNEVVTFFLASDLTRQGAGGGDASEDIEVHQVPLAGIDAWLRERQNAGRLVDPKVFAGLYFLSSRGQ